MKKRSSVLKITLISAAAVFFAGCGQNPFPDKKLTQGQIEQPPYLLDAPTTVECVTDKLCEFDIKASVLEGMGFPDLRMADLPTGAKFQSRNGTFSWTPTLVDRTKAEFHRMYVLLSSSNTPHVIGIARAIDIRVASTWGQN